MNAEILAVGTELLLGDILNTNAQYLSRELAALGINVFFQTAVGDNRERLTEAYRIAFARADVVITTGGLGPTDDDLTKEVAAEFFNRKMVLDEPSLEHIRAHFRGLAKMTDNNIKQAYIPEGAQIVPNAKGTAPGCILTDGGKTLIMLPGPPFEAEAMFRAEIVPYLKTKTDRTLVSKTLNICGIGESQVADIVNDILQGSNPTVAPYAKTNEVTLRVTACAKTEAEAYDIMKPTVDEIYRRIGEYIYGEDDCTLDGALLKLLAERNMKLATAESCTGGMLTSRLIDNAGASAVFVEGIVCYANESKINTLGVKPDTIEKYGAVSAETATEMAVRAAEKNAADVAISTTGVAGPDGGTDEKPIGLIYIGFYIKGRTFTKELRLKGDRTRIRQRTVVNALNLLLQEIRKY